MIEKWRSCCYCKLRLCCWQWHQGTCILNMCWSTNGKSATSWLSRLCLGVISRYILRFIEPRPPTLLRFRQNTTTVRHLKGQDDTKGVMIAALIGIEELAKRLRFIGMKLEQRLELWKAVSNYLCWICLTYNACVTLGEATFCFVCSILHV